MILTALERRALGTHLREVETEEGALLRYRRAAATVSAHSMTFLNAVHAVRRDYGMERELLERQQAEARANIRELRDSAQQTTLTPADRVLAQFPRRAREVGITGYISEARDFMTPTWGCNAIPLGIGNYTGAVTSKKNKWYSSFPC